MNKINLKHLHVAFESSKERKQQKTHKIHSAPFTIKCGNHCRRAPYIIEAELAHISHTFMFQRGGL